MTSLLIVALFSSLVYASDIKKNDVQTWPRSGAAEFGCFLEKAFQHTDKNFNCSLKHYKNAGDPCKDTGAYYEGPQFPQKKSKEVSPLVKQIELSWEHGELQGVSLTLSEKMSDQAARKALHLPQAGTAPPANIMDISVQDCGTNKTCVLLQGFDHLGAGDVDCGQ